MIKIKEKRKRHSVTLTDTECKYLKIISLSAGYSDKISTGIRELILMKQGGIPQIKVKESTPIEDEITPEVDEHYEHQIEKLDETEDIIVDSSLNGVVNRLIDEPFCLPLNGYPIKLIYNEAKFIRDRMGKRLRQEISSEFIKVKELRKFKLVNDRIESRTALPEDFKPGVNGNYNLIQDNIMDCRARLIFPLANLVHQFNCIVNHHEQFYTEGHIESVLGIENDPFEQFRDDIDSIIENEVVEFDAVEMIDDMINIETYDEHMVRLIKIANNKE